MHSGYMIVLPYKPIVKLKNSTHLSFCGRLVKLKNQIMEHGFAMSMLVHCGIHFN